jgi:acyl-CoA thioesterase FadM
VPFILARVRIDFRSQLRVDEVVRVQVCTGWISKRSFGMRYELRERDSGRLVAEAETVQATYDYERQRVVPVPDWLRAELEAIEGRPLPAKEGGSG